MSAQIAKRRAGDTPPPLEMVNQKPIAARKAARKADRIAAIATAAAAAAVPEHTPTHICLKCCGGVLPYDCNDTTKRVCSVCYLQKPTSEVLSLRRCKHKLCTSCLTRYFELSLDDKLVFPATCCGMPIPLQDAKRYIPDKVAKQYKAKTAEYAAVDRTYCHAQTCSALIPKYMIYDKQAVCPKCMAGTCAKCKTDWHGGPCIVVEDAQLMQLARMMNWRQCPHCQSLVERTHGCNHMTCRCGNDFCYACGTNYADCECGRDNVEEDDDDDVGCQVGLWD